MEIRSVACPPVNPPPSAPPPPQNTNAPEKRKRVRRWHHRGFTGCSTCRRRHVRCDEASPSCKNCTRLGLECDGTQGRMTFKVYGPPPPPAESSSAAAAKKGGKKSAANAGTVDGRVIKKEEEDDADNFDGVVVSPTTMAESKAVKYRFQEPMSPAGFMNTSLECVDGRYYTHFIDQVATLLLIYDNSINNNPFRRHFPEMAHSSQPVASAMQALGALHLANTSQAQSSRNQHFQQAMGKYGEVVKSFRTRYNNPDQNVRLTDFATCLLLSLFEMMDSQNHNWAIHLKGAREIYRILFLPNTDPQKEADRLSETNHPLRQFLVSLLSYLDVAGACNTGEGTVVEGSYWRTHGGGWEYNLGTPSLSADTNESPLLVELRHRWSIMMEIQAAISAFGKAKQQGYVSIEQQDMVYNELLSRLVQWRQAAPDCFQQLGGLDDESLSHYPYPDILEYAGCIEAYEKATNIFLYRVAAAERPDCQPPRPLMDMLSSRILALIRRLAKDVGQLAVLWPLFTAGRETRDEQEQKYVRQTMLELQRFGFKNVEKALEEIEKAWFKQRAFPDGWVDRMQDVRTSILLP